MNANATRETLVRLLPLIVSVVVSLFFCAVALVGITDRPVASDDHQNARMAYHLATSGVISYAERAGEEVTPTMRREPLPIIVGALFYWAHPGLSQHHRLDEVTAGPQVRFFKQVNVIWALLLFAGIFALCSRLFEPVWLGVVSGVVVSAMSLKLFVATAADRFLTEIPTAAFLVWSALALLNFSRRPSMVSGAYLGGSLALLALTKASFFYIVWVALLLVAFFLWWRARGRSNEARNANIAMQVGRRLGIAALTFMLICSVWMSRNLIHFGQFSMTERGGDVLYLRLLEMEQPMGGAIFAWSPGPYREWVGPLTGYVPQDLERGERLAVLNRGNGLEALHRQRWRGIYQERMEAAGQPYMEMTRGEREVWLGRAAIRAYLEDPIRYLTWLPVFAYKGSFVGADEMMDLQIVGKATPFHLALALFLNFLVVALIGVLRMSERLFPVYILPAGLVAMNIMLTHNIIRYNEPVIPFIGIALLLTLFTAGRNVRRQWAARHSR